MISVHTICRRLVHLWTLNYIRMYSARNAFSAPPPIFSQFLTKAYARDHETWCAYILSHYYIGQAYRFDLEFSIIKLCWIIYFFRCEMLLVHPWPNDINGHAVSHLISLMSHSCSHYVGRWSVMSVIKTHTMIGFWMKFTQFIWYDRHSFTKTEECHKVHY